MGSPFRFPGSENIRPKSLLELLELAMQTEDPNDTLRLVVKNFQDDMFIMTIYNQVMGLAHHKRLSPAATLAMFTVAICDYTRKTFKDYIELCERLPPPGVRFTEEEAKHLDFSSIKRHGE